MKFSPFTSMDVGGANRSLRILRSPPIRPSRRIRRSLRIRRTRRATRSNSLSIRNSSNQSTDECLAWVLVVRDGQHRAARAIAAATGGRHHR